MMAALWLVVAIASVTMYFSIDARERRQLGLDAAERGRARAAALGALAMTQARLDAAQARIEKIVAGPDGQGGVRAQGTVPFDAG